MLTYDKLYLDGAWVAPAGTDTLDVIDSTTEEVFATIPAGVPADIDRAVAAAKAAFPAWSEEPAPERGKLLRPRRGRAGGSARRDRRSDHARSRYAQGTVGGDPGRHRHLGVLDGRGACVDVRVRGHQQWAGRARTHRRGGLHHTVELPAQPDRREGRVRARGRLHGDPQAVRGRAGERVHPRGDHRRHRLPAGRVQPGLGRRPGRRRSARGSSRRRHDLVHRFHPCRSAGRRARRPLDQEDRAGTRREVAECPARRRRLSRSRSRRAWARRTRTPDRRAARSPA